LRIVIDLQSCQAASRFRGIGRYSLSLSKAIARRAGNHEIWLLLNDLVPDSIPFIRNEFDGLISKERIAVFAVNGPVAEHNPNNLWRVRAAEKVREYFLSGLQPDIVHVTSLFEGWGEHVVSSIGTFDQNLHTVVTLYDLIPFFHQKTYLPEKQAKNFYLRKIQSLKKADLLLTISDYSKRQAVNALGLKDESVVNISAAVEGRFKQIHISNERKKALLDRNKITKPFILCAPGGFDERKNIPGLLDAYSRLNRDLRKTHQLLIIGKPLESAYLQIAKKAKKAGLENDDLILTGYVPDDDLIALYNLCQLFVYPSLYEGFGLPALEAMACGAPVIASDATSIPEVIDRRDALFDPARPRTITRMMHHALTDENFRQSLREYGLVQAKKFSWDESAKKAIAAYEGLQEQNLERKKASVSVPKTLPRLAFVSPLPPEQSGISTYSAELLPELARFYDITLIIDQASVDDPALSSNFPAQDVAWFEAHAGEFDRILYQMGNSHFHKHMLAMLNQHPGVIVLHDFYLSNLFHWMEETNYSPGIFHQTLYYSHGYPALAVLDHQGVEKANWIYPCNKSLIDQADGLIVHSQYAINAAQKWYGDNLVTKFWHIPQLRSLPPKYNREQTRAELGINSEDFLVCSFGLLNRTKLNHRLLDAWLGSTLAHDRRCHLVFVGENNSGEYAQYLLDKISSHRPIDNIRITGYVSPKLYCQYLEIADVAVQLRALSRGETSRSVLDTLAYGVPTIINAHGTMSDYQDNILIKLPDEFSDKELIESLEHLRNDANLRKQISMEGQRYIKGHHNPGKISEEYHKAIENFATLSQTTRYNLLINSLANLSTPVGPSETDLLITAETIAFNTPQVRQRQLLVDVSILMKQDLKTGIERVTRSVLSQLLSNPPEGYRIEPVYLDNGIFRYARCFTTGILGVGKTGLQDDKIELQQNDIFLGLDWNPYNVSSDKELFRYYTLLGVEVIFVIYDLLPVLRPDFFPPVSQTLHGNWLQTITEVAHGLVCISRSVAEELHAWLDAHPPKREESLSIGYFPLGADIKINAPATEFPDQAAVALNAMKKTPSFLMVGTIEPRKGYSQALSAFDKLWFENKDLNLIIVGHEGWKALEPDLRENITEISERIRNHDQYGKRLFWLESISDEHLESFYAASTCLIFASEAEGFGLPIVEAARKKLPIIARDIPVFREVAGNHAFYFQGLEPEALANAINAWIGLQKKGKAPTSIKMPWLTWEESTQKLLEIIIDGQWETTLKLRPENNADNFYGN
jgi:glycosyltransferase involved in cell wall biosynthesis